MMTSTLFHLILRAQRGDKRANAALQPLEIGAAIRSGLCLALTRLGGSEHAK